MDRYWLNIDGKEVSALPGQTILEVCREKGIDIPTLCFDERTEIYGGCGLCVVEIEGDSRLWKACATETAPGMVVRTDTERLRESRKTNLELLLSNHKGDCRAPCTLACPAGTDCQGYVGLIANGKYKEALELIRESIPLPGSIGRICPRPCEDACRRALVEEPIAIACLKRFAADAIYGGGSPFVPECAPDTGRRIAVAGGGPYGLSVAYFLRKLGHAVTVFEAMPEAGGMLRYGIPEYRLPKKILDREIEILEKMGIEIKCGVRVGSDISLNYVRKTHDAVCVGIGAQASAGLGCEGEESEGVMGAVEFLRKAARGEPVDIGRRVAVVGGGNTAMDAARCALRLGAETVCVVYRRSKEEMGADEEEIKEAREEGVIFLDLVTPSEIVSDERGHCTGAVLQVMEPGERDAAGRRKPVAVPGKTRTIDVDTVIAAVGQRVDAEGMTGVELTGKGGIVYDSATYMSALPGVFVGGDCGNDKISIAVDAIGDAKNSARVVDSYLSGKLVPYSPSYSVTRDDVTAETLSDREKKRRVPAKRLDAPLRRGSFEEIAKGFTRKEAFEEANRCLGCGCGDYFECKLIGYSDKFGVRPERFEGERHFRAADDTHPFILRDPNKCILCGLCVRVCDEVMGVGALGLAGRGFDVAVMPSMGAPLEEAGCIACGQCADACPTGAFQEVSAAKKPVPVRTEETETVCAFCSVGCSVKTESRGDLLIKSVPNPKGRVNKGLMCGRGKFALTAASSKDPLDVPLLQKDGFLFETSRAEAYSAAAARLREIFEKYGSGSVAVSVSDRYTNEEAYALRAFAKAIDAKVMCFNNRPSGSERVLGINASPNTIDELRSAEVILCVGFLARENEIIRVKLHQAAKRGARVVLIEPEGYCQEDMPFAYRTVRTENSTRILREIAKALIDMKRGESDPKGGKTGKELKEGSREALPGKEPKEGSREPLSGEEELRESLRDVIPESVSAEIAELYASAATAMIVFQQNVLTTSAAALAADLAVLSGHIGKEGDGILVLKAKNNSQGLVDVGITEGAESLGEVKALLIFGEDPYPALSEDLEFLLVCDTHLTETVKRADVVLPGREPLHASGTYLNTERRIQRARPAMPGRESAADWMGADRIARGLGRELPFSDEKSLIREMKEELSWYESAKEGEVCGAGEPGGGNVENAESHAADEKTKNADSARGERVPENDGPTRNWRKPGNVRLTGADTEDLLVDPLPCTDALMKEIDARLKAATGASETKE